MLNQQIAVTVLSLLFSFLTICATENCKGCVPLDQYSFDKIISKFNVSLIKFDVAYPYGPKQEVFAKLAEEVNDNHLPDVILGEVGIKDYGEKDNEALGTKYGLTKDNIPALRLFYRGKILEYSSTETWTLDSLREFLRINTNLYIGLPGCIENFDKLAMKFVEAEKSKKEVLMKEAEKEAGTLSGEKESSAKVYIKFMKKIIDSGLDFVTQETARLAKLLSEGKIKEEKKGELKTRLNILRSFAVDNLKDEL